MTDDEKLDALTSETPSPPVQPETASDLQPGAARPPAVELPQEPLFQIKNLTMRSPDALRGEIEDFSLTLDSGATVTLLGEIGCGKEAVLRALTGLVARGEDVTGTIRLGMGEAKPIADAMPLDLRTAFLPGPLNPVLYPNAGVLLQLCRIVAHKRSLTRDTALDDFSRVWRRLADATDIAVLDATPSQIAPQHLATALLACALAQAPQLVIAADPLAELSPVHAQTFAAALKEEQARLGFALLCAGASAAASNVLGGDVVVLRAGRVVESGAMSRLGAAQSHAYTQTLFRATASVSAETPAPRSGPRRETVLQVQGVQLAGQQKKDPRTKLTFELRRGGSLALLGEEGSGRRALTRALLGLDPVMAGRVVFDQVDIGILSGGMMARLRRRIAFVTGEDDALDPRLTIHDAVSEPLRAYLRMPGEQIARNRDAALKRVGLAALPGTRTVASLSRFDRRRLQIARAIVGAPLLAVIDEPLRGLDAFAQSVLRDLLRSFRSQENPAFLVITADFALAQAFCEEAFVFQDGRIVERGPMTMLAREPKEPQTRKLAEAAAPKSGLSPQPAEV